MSSLSIWPEILAGNGLEHVPKKSKISWKVITGELYVDFGGPAGGSCTLTGAAVIGSDSESFFSLESNMATGGIWFFSVKYYLLKWYHKNGEISRLTLQNSMRICQNLPWAKSDPLVWEICRVYRSGQRFWQGMVWSMPRKSRKFHEKWSLVSSMSILVGPAGGSCTLTDTHHF